LSGKNQESKHDPEIHQTKKGNQWYFGLKVHVGVNVGNGYVHTMVSTSVNVHDVSEAIKLLRKEDNAAYSDLGYLGVPDCPEIRDDEALSKIGSRINK